MHPSARRASFFPTLAPEDHLGLERWPFWWSLAILGHVSAPMQLHSEPGLDPKWPNAKTRPNVAPDKARCD